MVEVIIGFCVINIIWAVLFIIVLSVRENKTVPKMLGSFMGKDVNRDNYEPEFTDATNEQILNVFKESAKNINKSGVEEIE